MRRSAVIRLCILVAVIGGLWLVARATGLTAQLSRDSLRDAVDQAGAWGVALFVAAFSVGSLLHVPGLIFVAVAVAAWGPWLGGTLALGAAIVSVHVSFFVVRGLGGSPLAAIEQPLFRKLLAQLGRRPVLTIFALRTVFTMGAPVNYALALSAVSLRDYFLGSALGLIAPVYVCSAALHFLLW